MGLNLLPEDCVSMIISFTTPADVIRLSLVSKLFFCAAQSDAVWEKFLPPEYHEVLVSLSRSYPSKKQLYFALCDHPVLIDDGKKSLSLEKQSGKKCYMLSARDLVIIWSSNPGYWRWIPFSGSRFPEVTELISVCWLEIRGNISTRMLSEDTLYVANLVFKLTENSYGLEYPADVTVGIAGREGSKGTACFDSEESDWGGWRPERAEDCGYPKERQDGWLEIELGEIFNNGGEDEEVEMSLKEVTRLDWKRGLIVHGIEIKPRPGH